MLVWIEKQLGKSVRYIRGMCRDIYGYASNARVLYKPTEMTCTSSLQTAGWRHDFPVRHMIVLALSNRLLYGGPHKVS